MQYRILKEPDFQNVAASGTALSRVNTKGNLHKLLFRMVTSGGVLLTVAQMKAACSGVRLKLDGDVKREVDVTHLLEIQKYYGDIALGGNVAGVCVLDLTRPVLNSFGERALYSYGLGNVKDVIVEIDVVSVATLARIELYSVTDDMPIRDLGDHVVVNKYPRTFADTGDQEENNLPKDDRMAKAYLAAHIRYTTGTLNYVTFKRNGVDAFVKLTPELNQVALGYAKRTPQTNYFHLDFDLGNSFDSVLPVPADSLYMVTNWAVAPTAYAIFLERIFKDPKK